MLDVRHTTTTLRGCKCTHILQPTLWGIMSAGSEAILFGPRRIAVVKRGEAGSAETFAATALALLVEEKTSKVRCLVYTENDVVANFAVDPRISLVVGVEGKAEWIGLSAFDYSRGQLLETDFVFGMDNTPRAREFVEVFRRAQASMAVKMLDNLFDENSERCFEDNVVMTARSLAKDRGGGECGVAKRALVRMLKEGSIEKTSPLQAVFEALKGLIDKLPVKSGHAEETDRHRAVAKTKRLKGVVSQLEEKINDLLRDGSGTDDQRPQKLAKYRLQHKIVSIICALYDKLADTNEATDEDLEAANKLLSHIRSLGESCRKIFEAEVLKLMQRLEVAKRRREDEDDDDTDDSSTRSDFASPPTDYGDKTAISGNIGVVTPIRTGKRTLSLDLPTSPVQSTFDMLKSPFELPTSPCESFCGNDDTERHFA